jgi:hypothetical protein
MVLYHPDPNVGLTMLSRYQRNLRVSLGFTSAADFMRLTEVMDIPLQYRWREPSSNVSPLPEVGPHSIAALVEQVAALAGEGGGDGSRAERGAGARLPTAGARSSASSRSSGSSGSLVNGRIA